MVAAAPAQAPNRMMAVPPCPRPSGRARSARTARGGWRRTWFDTRALAPHDDGGGGGGGGDDDLVDAARLLGDAMGAFVGMYTGLNWALYRGLRLRSRKRDDPGPSKKDATKQGKEPNDDA